MVIRNLAGEASRGPLDLFALVDRGARGSGYCTSGCAALGVRVNRSVSALWGRVVVHVNRRRHGINDQS